MPGHKSQLFTTPRVCEQILRRWLPSSRSFQSSSEIKTNRLRTANDSALKTPSERTPCGLKQSEKDLGRKDRPLLVVFVHIPDTALPSPKGNTLGPCAKDSCTPVGFLALGHVGQLLQCLICTTAKELDLEILIYLRFQLL